MQSKSLLIAIAAFAVTATGAQAYVGTKYAAQAGLSSGQVQALQQARDLRRKGEVEKARDVLLEAGVTDETMASLRKASHDAIHDAVEANDFAAFKEAIEGTPLYDLITTEADFALFREAHTLKEDGKFVEAKEILDDLGVAPHHFKKGHGRMGRGLGIELSDEERDALRAATQANDKETVAAILKQAGVSEDKIERVLSKRGWR